MSTATVQQLDKMPPCVGDQALPGDRCRIRPAKFVMGMDLVGNEPGLVYAAACVFHLAELEDWLSRNPWGSWTAPYEAQVLRDIRADVEDGSLASAWEIARADALGA